MTRRMTDVRIIKKYPNRRLYDTEISRYITLEEVRQLVLQNVQFRVEDKRTHEDITRSILLQVIAEQEEGGNPIFTTELLHFIIRYLRRSDADQHQPLSGAVDAAVHGAAAPLHRPAEADARPGRSSRCRSCKEMADQQVPIWRSVRTRVPAESVARKAEGHQAPRRLRRRRNPASAE